MVHTIQRIYTEPLLPGWSNCHYSLVAGVLEPRVDHGRKRVSGFLVSAHSVVACSCGLLPRSCDCGSVPRERLV